MNAGEVEYKLAVDTKAAIKAAAEAEKNLDKMEGSLKNNEKSAKSLNTSLSPLAAAIRRAFGRESVDSVARVKNEMSSLVGALGKVAAAAGIVMSASAFGGLIKKNIDLAHSTLDVAEKLGTTTEALSKLRYAASQTAGMGSQDFDIALQRMTRRLAEAAEGGGVAKDAIKELGLSAQELSKAGPEEAFRAIMEQMSKLPDQADRVRLAFKFFDSGGVKLAQTAKGGAAGIDELSKSLEEMGGVITTDFAQQSADLNGKLEAMSKRFEAVGINIASQALPSMEEFVDLLNDPKITQSLTDIANAIVKLGAWAIKGAAEVAKAMRWIGEEIAILQNGIGLHDTARLEEQYERHKKIYERAKNDATSYAKHTDTIVGKLKNSIMAPSAEFVENARLKMEKSKRELDKSRELMEGNKLAASQTPKAPAMDLPDLPQDFAKKQEKVTKATKAQRDANADLIESLKLTAATMLMSREEAILYKMGIDGATEAQLKQAESLLELNKTQQQSLDAQKNYESQMQSLKDEMALVGLEGKELAQTQAVLALGEYATDEQIEKVRELAAELYAAQELAKMDDVLKKYDKGKAAESDFETKMSELQMLLDAKKISEDEYRQYTLDAEKALHDQLRSLDEERFRNQSEMNAALLDAMDNFASGAGNAFGSVLLQTATAREAVHGLAKSIAGDLLGSMFKVAAQMAINAAKEKMFAAQSASTAAATGAAMTAAYTPAAAAASVASFGGAATAGMSSMASAIPAMMALFGGARKNGGPVEPGKYYQVNEGGDPELFNVGRKQYMMPNQKGEVISNKDATAGGGVNVVVNLTESPEGGGNVSQRQEGGTTFIDIIVADIMSDGQTASVIENKWGLSTQGR